MENSKGTLVIISGFSGVGKGTVSRALVEEYGYSLSVSATTRQPRQGEKDGVDYYFKTEEDFLNLVRENGFIEYAQYVDHYYGTLRSYVEEELELGHTVILEIEVQGAMQIKAQYPQALLIFVTAPSAADLRDRLTNRGTEDPEVIQKRMTRAREEALCIDSYDYIVCNENNRLAQCMDQIHTIIQGAELRVSQQQEFITRLRQDLNHSF